jgi:hypothetical protein
VICGAVFIPSTPLLIPGAGAGAQGELRDIREASVSALSAALTTQPDRVVIVGAGTVTETHHRGQGSLRGFGVPFDVALDPRDTVTAPTRRRLPLALTVGAWLLGEVGWSGERRALEVDAMSSDDDLDAIGHALASDDSETLLLVVADGSASRTEKAPAALHPDAEAFDARLAVLLSGGDPQSLLAIDRDRAQAVTAAGRPAWRVAAVAMGGAAYTAELLATGAPYGVGYLVARWHR